MNQDFKKFTIKLITFGSPIIFLLATYYLFDPFQIVYSYDAYPTNYAKTINRNRISTQVFLNNNPQYNYQSFILGSSRSSVFYSKEWGNYIGDSMTYHFDASNEIIGGIARKLQFIEQQGNSIKNVLILLDHGNFEYVTDTSGTIFIEDYRVAQNIARLPYHFIFLSSYFKEGYFIKYLDYKLFNTFRPYMNGSLENREIVYTPIHNDFIFKSYIEDIAKDSVAYYSRDYFYKRDVQNKISKPVIRDAQLIYLKQIKEVFERNNTDYQFVISPSYDQIEFNKTDIAILERYFDKNRIHNYAGKNKFTEPKTNFYEIYHFKPTVAREIMKEIYTKANQ